MLLNSPLLDRQSRRFAARLEAETPQQNDTASLITRAYRLALSRSPGEEELALGRKFLESPHDEFSDRVADFCLVLFNLDEFLYID
jgi:hypothetical protein